MTNIQRFLENTYSNEPLVMLAKRAVWASSTENSLAFSGEPLTEDAKAEFAAIEKMSESGSEIINTFLGVLSRVIAKTAADSNAKSDEYNSEQDLCYLGLLMAALTDLNAELITAQSNARFEGSEAYAAYKQQHKAEGETVDSINPEEELNGTERLKIHRLLSSLSADELDCLINTLKEHPEGNDQSQKQSPTESTEPHSSKFNFSESQQKQQSEITEKLGWIMELGALASMSSEFPVENVTDEAHKPLGYAASRLADEILEDFDLYNKSLKDGNS